MSRRIVFYYQSEEEEEKEEREKRVAPERIPRLDLAQRVSLPLDDLVRYQRRIDAESEEFSQIEWRKVQAEGARER